MTYPVEFTETAKKELLEAYAWIREESPHKANQWLNEAHAAIQPLSEFPLRCPLAPENNLFSQDVRQLLYGKHSGIYRILFFIQENTVYIAHVRHGARRPLDE